MIKHIHTYITIVFILVVGSAQAQLDNTMYYMTRLPQSNYINIAAQPECKSFISGFGPIFSVPGSFLILQNLENGNTYPPNYYIGVLAALMPPSLAFSVSTPLDVNDILPIEGDSLVTPIYNKETFDKFANKLHKNNYFSTHTEINFLYFGWKRGKNYWTVDLSTKNDVNFNLPGSLFTWAYNGNYTENTLDLSGLGVNVNAYNQASLGFNRQVTRYLFLSARLKFLQGIANVTTSQSNLKFVTDENNYAFSTEAKYQVKTNMPLDVTLDSAGYIETIEFAIQDSNINKMYKNFGWGLDFGFSQDYNSALTFFGNVQDLGYIDWKNTGNTISLDEKKSAEFKGIPLDDVIENGFDEATTALMDSLVKNYNFSHSNENYRTYLPYKIYAGFRYKATRWLHLGFVSRFEKMPVGFNPSYTASLNLRPGKLGQLTFTYSYINNNFNNVGMGYSTRFGNMQWFLISDNILGSVLTPDNSRNMSLRIGCNLVMGYKDKLSKRVPLLDPATSENYSNKVPDYGKSNKIKKKKE